MATIGTESNGHRRILFVATDGTRKTIRLGKCSERDAEQVCRHVETLAAATIHGQPVTRETALWLSGIGDTLHDRLARAGLCKARQTAKLGEWLDKLLTEKQTELKPESYRKLRRTQSLLLEYFDSNLPLAKLTTEHAAAWRQALRTKGLSEASQKIHASNAKGLIAEATRRGLIDRNPLEHLKGGATASNYRRYITPEEIAKVIEAAPKVQWKLLLGLARYAGLRTPSETHRLTWADVDFERGRLLVHSPKTERHPGRGERMVPIRPELMKLLQDRFIESEEGEQELISLSVNRAVPRVARWCQLAGIEPWERTWQTLRASCEKDWAMSFPQFAVSQWIGHSITVSGRHYANSVPDELFTQAAQKAARIPAQQGHEMPRNGPQVGLDEKSKDSRKPLDFQSIPQLASHCEDNEKTEAIGCGSNILSGKSDLGMSRPSRRDSFSVRHHLG